MLEDLLRKTLLISILGEMSADFCEFLTTCGTGESDLLKGRLQHSALKHVRRHFHQLSRRPGALHDNRTSLTASAICSILLSFSCVSGKHKESDMFKKSARQIGLS